MQKYRNTIISSKKFNLLLCSISGILLSISSLYENLWWVSFFALIPLAYSFLAFDSKKVYLRVLCFSIFYYLPQLTWIFHLNFLMPFNKLSSIIILSIGQILIMLVQSLYIWLALLIFPKIKKGRLFDVFSFSALYIFCEWMQENTFLYAFPWLELGSNMTKFKPFIQSASIFGGLFISFIMVICCASISYIILNLGNKKQVINASILMCSVFVSNLVFGIIRIETTIPNNDTVKVATVSEKYQGEEKWRTGTDEMLSELLKISEQAAENGAKIIVWPETAIPINLNEESNARARISNFSKDNSVVVFAGGFYVNDDDERFNAVIGFDEDGTLSEPYCKQILVPFGEEFPFGDFIKDKFPEAEELMDIATGLTKSINGSIIDTNYGKVGVIICYESVFSHTPRNCISLDSGLLVIPTNDAWLTDDYAMRKHYEHSIIRAVESNRFVLRSSNAGITAIIDQMGNELVKINSNTTSYALGDVSFIYKKSFYSVVGDIIIIPAVFIILRYVLNFIKVYFNRKR